MMLPRTAPWAAKHGFRSIGLVLGVIVSSLVGFQLLRAVAGTPLRALEDPWNREQSVLDRHGQPLRRVPSSTGVRGAPLALEAMGDRLVSATLVSEDRRFYEHAGVDYAGVLRAIKQNVHHGRLVSGASTVTQQLVKLLDSSGQPDRRGPWLKLVETARAINLERELSKREILTAYINRLNYGHALVGPERAAHVLFGKAPSQLSWAEAALLAVLPRAPSSLDPYRHPSRVKLRQQALLRALAEHGFLSQAELDRALGSHVHLVPVSHPFEAPHFVNGLLDDARLESAHEIQTTLDLDLQRDVEGVVQSQRERLRGRSADNAAAIVVDNASGEILAYVGSVDFRAPPSGQVDHAAAPRQAGSTLKPFVYALAFSHGLGPNDLLADVPTRFDPTGDRYAPTNFDGVFHGPVSARVALASSLNVPAVRAAATLPRGALLRWLLESGMQHLDAQPDHYGLTLALGSGEVTLRELVQAYASLARGGRSVQLSSHTDERTEHGQRMLGQPQGGREVLPAESVAEVVESLSDPLARVLGLGGQGPFALEFPTAVKTGTSSGYRDGWTVGFTHERTVGVWVGNSSGAPTRELTGASGAGPIFAEVMRRAMRDVGTPAALYADALLAEVQACPLSGLRAGPACPAPVTRKIGRSRRHGWHEHECGLHRHGHSLGGAARFSCSEPGQSAFVALPDDYAEWLAAEPPGAPGRDPNRLPWLLASLTPGCSELPRARLEIVEPRLGSVFLANTSGVAKLSPRLQLLGDKAFESVEFDFEVDGRWVTRSRASDEVLLALGRGDHELMVRPTTRTDLGLVATRFSIR